MGDRSQRDLIAESAALSIRLAEAEAEVKKLTEERDSLRRINESVAVCSTHTPEIVGTDCLVCLVGDLEEKVDALVAALKEANSALFWYETDDFENHELHVQIREALAAYNGESND